MFKQFSSVCKLRGVCDYGIDLDAVIGHITINVSGLSDADGCPVHCSAMEISD
jgi:hypothetical protein